MFLWYLTIIPWVRFYYQYHFIHKPSNHRWHSNLKASLPNHPSKSCSNVTFVTFSRVKCILTVPGTQKILTTWLINIRLRQTTHTTNKLFDSDYIECFPKFSLSRKALYNKQWGWSTWVAHSVKHPTLYFGSGHDLTVRRFKSHIRLWAGSTQPPWDSLSPCLCP